VERISELAGTIDSIASAIEAALPDHLEIGT
jgi:hypothetical protein